MHAGKPLDPTTGRGRGRERSTTEFGAQGEVLLRSTVAPLRRRSEKVASAPSLSTYNPGRRALAEIMAIFVIIRRREKCVYVCI